MTPGTALPRGRGDELVEFAHAALSLRWLVLAALLLYDVFTPSTASTPLALYVGILTYTLGLTLYAWRFPPLATRAARLGVVFDTLTIGIGMRVAAHPEPFFYYGFVTSVVAGLLLGHWGAAVSAGVVGLLQLPPLRGSLFAPGMYAAWAFAALALQGGGHAAAVAAARIRRHAGVTRFLASVGEARESAESAAEDADRILGQVMNFLRADSGSVMLFEPQDERLEILVARGLHDTSRQARLRLGEGVAGWVAQEGQPVLLTPDVSVPVPLQRAEIGSSMSIPLSSGGRLLGVINLNRGTDRPWFSREDLKIADLAGGQLAAALIRAQQERAVAAILANVTSSFVGVSRALLRDPAVLWPVLLDQTRALTGAQFAVLALEREDTGTLDVVASRGIGGQAALTFLPGLLAASTDGRLHMAGAHTHDAGPAIACLPLRLEERRIGAIGLGLSGAAAVSAPQLEAVAGLVAAAVHTARTANRVADIGVVEERRRIAREMHDGLAQTLADALLQTDLSAMAAQGNPGEVVGDLKELRTLLEGSMRELREFMSELRREPETRGEFPAALEELGREFQRREEIPTSVVVTGDATRLPSAAKYALLAIVRQALTNVRTHANASTVTIRAEVSDDTCTATVTDNGIGFDVAAFRAHPPGPHHLGLVSMEERAALVGGRLAIDASPGRGTTVTVRVPLGRTP